MTKGKNTKAFFRFTAAGKAFVCGVLAFPLLFMMCGTADGAAEKPKSKRVAAKTISAEPVKMSAEASDSAFSALVDLLEIKKVLTAEEAAGFRKNYAARGAAGGAEGMAALLALLERKNILEPGEMDSFRRQYVGERSITLVPDVNEKARMEQLTASVTEEVRKGLQDDVKRQVQEELPKEMQKSEQGSAPEWAKRVRFGGDVRLRYQHDRYSANNAELVQPSNPTQLMNTRVNADRFKYRVRVSGEVDLDDNLQAAVRIGTGNDTNPLSTTLTMGDYANRDRVYIDLAYVKWKPIEQVTVIGGRMRNPFFHTDLVWDPELNPEGFAALLRQSIGSDWSVYATAGAFPLQYNDLSRKGKWLYGYQLGVERKEEKGVGANIAVAYYDYRNVTGVLNEPYSTDNDWTSPQYQQKGNTLFNIDSSGGFRTALASEFKELNVTGKLDIGFWDPVHVVFIGDYVKNIGYKSADVAARTGNTDAKKYTKGYQIGLEVGHPEIRAFGQWKLSLNYKYLGADAVLDAFTDSFFHLGGTNAKGWIFGGELGLTKRASIALRYMTSDEISGPPLSIDAFRADLNFRF